MQADFASLPAEVQEALRAADKLVAALQKSFPSYDGSDALASAYNEVAFTLDRIEGMPHV